MVLVRLDIMKTKNNDLNNHGGDIESYLESFCRWQKKINPGDWRQGDIEGNNFESVFVIAHEMGHNLGMNHDGETTEGNRCSPDQFLMSPVLGPGKVTWSTCSNRELTEFLTSSDTLPQASCLDDLPALMDLYDFTSEGLLPGEKFSALQQCQQAFGSLFKPHMQNQSPFEDLCRELWCSNSTHALRA